jgi:hypothetical protein
VAGAVVVEEEEDTVAAGMEAVDMEVFYFFYAIH